MIMAEQAMKVYAMREAMRYYERADQALSLMRSAPASAVFDAIIGRESAAFNFEPYSEQLTRLEGA